MAEYSLLLLGALAFWYMRAIHDFCFPGLVCASWLFEHSGCSFMLFPPVGKAVGKLQADGEWLAS